MNLIEVFNKRTQDLIALMTTNFKLKADKTELAAHTGNKENPHGTELTHFGVNASATELNHVKGVTNGIQTQLDGKSDEGHKHALADVTDVTASATEVNYTKGVKSAIQTQLDGKSDSDHTHTVDSSLSSTSTNPVQNKVVKTELDKKATEEALDNHAANKTTNVLHVTSTEKNTWNNKSDFSGNYNDLENAPNIVEDGTGTLQIMDSQNNIMMEVDKEGLAVATLTVNGVGDVATALTQHEEAIETNKTNIDLKANKTDLTSHTGNKSNPHGVILTQLGVTATAAELNKLDGVTATTAELNYVDGVTSNIQTQLNAKQATITGAATTITGSDLTKSRALVSNSNGKVAVSAVTSTELGYLDGVTSNVQAQLDGKSDDGHTHTVSEISDITASKTELNYVKGVTSAIQTQLDQKAAISHGNHVPATETANNAKFLRNDNTWQTVTPANIGAATTTDLAVKLDANLGTSNANKSLTTDASGKVVTTGDALKYFIVNATLEKNDHYEFPEDPKETSTVLEESRADFYYITADKTYSDIVAAVSSGLIPIMILDLGGILKITLNYTGYDSWTDFIPFTGYLTSFLHNAFNNNHGTRNFICQHNVTAFICPHEDTGSQHKINPDYARIYWDGVANIHEEVNRKMDKSNAECTGSFSMNRYNKNSYDTIIGEKSSTLGDNCSAIGIDAHAQGKNTIAYGEASSAQGYQTMAFGDYSHAEGEGDIAEIKITGDANATIYTTNAASMLVIKYYGLGAVVQYDNVYAIITSIDVDNYQITTDVTLSSSAISSQTATMYCGVAGGKRSHSEGYWCNASGYCSHAEGSETKAIGSYSHAAGIGTIALADQLAIGHFNDTTTATGSAQSGTSSDSAFVIGNGNANNGSNAFRVTYAGTPYAKNALTTTGCDYAEFFEWFDGNPNSEDRRGYFVTLDGEKITKAKQGDYILGITSALPSIIGNGDECWKGRYILDEFGGFIEEEFEYEVVVDRKVIINEETGERTVEEIKEKKIGTKYKENPDYDPTAPYVQRSERPEWSTVGMLGVIAVRDDGSCKVNGFCTVSNDGTAIASDNGYRVVARVTDNIVKVIFR